ncbi:MAG: hypothetical protein IJO92_01700 [Clostridia bacterium]|nr:hypothetical protein [Clostridia bacterium]
MKKVFVWLMAGVLLISCTACAGGGNLEGDATENPGVMDGGNPDDNGNANNSGNADNGGNTDQNPIKTIGQRLADDFKALLNPEKMMGARAMADELLKGDYLTFDHTTTDVQPGKLKGFGDAEITGFKEGVMIEAKKEDVPFLAYIFTLDDDTDAETFMTTLKSKANPQWNTKVKADEMFTERSEKQVFFVMSPKSLDK